MAATKITVNHNGSIRVEGDFEIFDPEGKPFGLAGRTTIGLEFLPDTGRSSGNFNETKMIVS
jgi:hypothetical protein